MRRLFCLASLAVGLFLTCGLVQGDVVDFEDLPPLDLPATPFNSNGLLFESTSDFNAVFPAGFSLGADNGTQILGWCGSNCSDDPQVITLTFEPTDFQGVSLFDITSLDAGNLVGSGIGQGEFVPGMKIVAEGFYEDGTSIVEDLFIIENVFTTFELEGFTNLTRLELTAPPVLAEGVEGFPDPVLDNVVWNPASGIPEPSSAALVIVMLGGLSTRRKRS